MTTALHHLKLISDGNISHGKAVLIEDEVIVAVIDENEIPERAQRITLNGAYLAPGLIDLQIYGAGKPLFFGGDPSAKALEQMEAHLLNEGCTGFLATIATNTNAVVEQGIYAALAYRDKRAGNYLGLHLEGPYLNPERKGAHPAHLIKKASLPEVKHWVEMAQGEIKMITLAPELQDADVLAYLDEQNIVISSGHSNATYQQAQGFIHQPVKAITHLYNAMPQMHHRNPGIIPAIFEHRPYTSIVADGIHVDYAMIALAKRALGEKLFLITDAVSESTSGVYQHQLHGDHFTMPDGTLSGSNLSMLKALKNCVQHVNIPLAEAVNMASFYPAQLMGWGDKKGKILAGFDANMVVFDAEFSLKATIFKGRYITKTI